MVIAWFMFREFHGIGGYEEHVSDVFDKLNNKASKVLLNRFIEFKLRGMAVKKHEGKV